MIGRPAILSLAILAMSPGSGSAQRAARGSPQGKTILALGDSYTVGEGIDKQLAWPAQLMRELHRAGVKANGDAVIAKTGWTTDELDKAITNAKLKGPFPLVTLLIGVNNQFRGRSVGEYGTQLRGLIARAIGLAGGEPSHVIVISIPDWGVTPFAKGRNRTEIAQAIDGFNAAAHDEAVRAGARWVDVTGVSRAPHDRWTAKDGLHPSESQYAAWVKEILPEARNVLTTR